MRGVSNGCSPENVCPHQHTKCAYAMLPRCARTNATMQQTKERAETRVQPLCGRESNARHAASRGSVFQEREKGEVWCQQQPGRRERALRACASAGGRRRMHKGEGQVARGMVRRQHATGCRRMMTGVRRGTRQREQQAPTADGSTPAEEEAGEGACPR